jgi:hypothetical protein
MINSAKDNEYRDCFNDKKGNFPYMKFNQFHTPYCDIDKNIQIQHYGCTPEDVIRKRLKNEN